MDIKHKFSSDQDLVILDSLGVWQDKAANKIFWSDLGSDSDSLYIPELVEKYGDELKHEYIRLVEGFGNSNIQGTSLKSALKQNEGFSFWWMTLLSEKSPWKSNEIFVVFKALILKKLLLKYDGDRIVIVSNDRKLVEWIEAQYFNSKKIIKHVKVGPNKKNSKKSWKDILPHKLQAVLYFLRFVISYKCVLFSSHSKSLKKKLVVEKDFTFIGYSDNLNSDEFAKGTIVSGYWGRLNEKLYEQGVALNWLMLFVSTPQYPSLKSILRARDKAFTDERESVFFLEEFSTLSMLKRVISRFLTLQRVGSKYQALLSEKASVLSFLGEDWKSSMYGVAAVDACFKFSLLEEAIDAFSTTDVSGKGIYLYENQGWERALTYMWQKKCSQEIYGFQHVSGKFFDLRPYDGFEEGAYVEAPLPDKIIVTGESAYKSLEQFGYPTKKLVIAESLRNLYLGKLKSIERSSEIRTLLVVTDYLKQATEHQLNILAESWEAIERNFDKVIVKPHPNCPVDEILSKCGIAREAIIDVDNRSLDQIWCETDVVFASNVTGAALESAYIALPTLVSFSADSFNMSPLRGIKGVNFVCSGTNIEKVLSDLSSPELPCNYLCLNQSLRLWEALLRN